MFGTCLKRCNSGVYRLVYRPLQKEDHQGRCVVVKVDEDYTSQICSCCKTKTLAKVTGAYAQNVRAILSCTSCGVKWNRDKNAARNIRNVSLHMATNNDQRAFQFKRETYQAATPKQNHMSGKPPDIAFGYCKKLTAKM